MFKTLKADIDAVMERDPAARSRAEVFFLYSGFKAVRSHRKANWCLRHNLKFLARWISQRSRHKTGIEIHPGATIGKGLFIDHGMGVVIGETTIIGDNCTIYQNVTLGGTGKETGKRHPTLGNNVLVGSGAKVLGPFKVGDNARIAAGAVVLSEVPPNATAVGVPARVVKVNGVRSETLDQIHVSDPVALALCNLEHKIFELQKQLDELKKEREQLQAFKKDAVMFFGCFIALALIYLAADPTPLPVCIALVEAGIAWLIVRGSQIARLMLLIMLPINTALGAASFGGAFDRFAWFMTEIHVRGFLPDNFKKTAYLIMAVVSAGLFVFLLFNRRISTYCSDPENEIDDILSHGVKIGRRRRRFK